MGLRSIYEWVQDLYPLVKYFCETTGQKLVVDDDATTGATYRRNSDPDAVSGASTKAEKVEKLKNRRTRYYNRCFTTLYLSIEKLIN
ncbi:hypothetical protein CGZ81_09885 [Lactobacillus acidophilus]|nr:hypothetical protein CGZ81_09885 [Lactobacillus acidophilus]